MAGMTDYLAANVLQYLTGKAAMPALASGAYIGLFTTAPTSDAGITGAVEVTGANYARVSTAAADWNTAVASVGSEPSVVAANITNLHAITFNAVGAGGWGTVVAFGLFDAAVGGNLLAWDYLGPFDWLPFSCSQASPGVFTSPGHGLTNGAGIVLTSKFGGTLPTRTGSWAGIQAAAGVAGDTFNVGVNTTSSGDGAFRQVIQQALPQSAQFSFSIGALKIAAA